MELEQLIEHRELITEQLANYFDGDELDIGDYGYQELLDDLERTEEKINDILNG